MPILHTGEVGVEHIAAGLGMSRQTLFRRLKAEGTTFETVLDGSENIADGATPGAEPQLAHLRLADAHRRRLGQARVAAPDEAAFDGRDATIHQQPRDRLAESIDLHACAHRRGDVVEHAQAASGRGHGGEGAFYVRLRRLERRMERLP